eukprot:GFYU01005436.1.p2 GENE.GFYU01005436.1~~GFYU01005436.1.p2  ORF type:complete len:201 (+),score=42.33 GFYU01005436.1:40-603(+)
MAAKSTNNKEKSTPFIESAYALILFTLVLNGCVMYLQDTDRHANKPYKTFEEFVPHYDSEHMNQTSRQLHFVGTTFVILWWTTNPSLVIAALMGGVTGYYCHNLFLGHPHGFFELGAAAITYLFFGRRFSGSWVKPLVPLIAGYAFAWVGHFYFEKNKPATFIYPIYSLAGDFYTWYRIVTRQYPLF